ncbi:hypothetical protein [Raoultibacter phocaeensis]|uniref:hypothetical protein n=1 Tax=Raoultibacter phocaeensis TaxID=2479841 RepID=UPI00111942A2|nr:hypothetical protein [Raoultibacter phocaeensis]
MKKTKTTLTALALTAALAMAAAPAALAADASVNETGSIASDGTASTTLNVYATASQIQATIPIDITIVTPAAGGTITAPSANAYKIVNNNTTTDLYVKSVQGVNANGWNAVDTLTSPASGMAATTGELKMTVKAGASNPLAIAAAATAVPEQAKEYFKVPAKGELGLTLAGESSVKTELTADSTYPAVKIAYTVAVPTA